jgi:DNA repair protein RadC
LKHTYLKFSYKVRILSPPIKCAEDTYAFLKKVWDLPLINLQEQFYVLFLNAASEVISWRCLSTGTYNETLYDVKLTLGCALGCQAIKIIIAHNHTNGILLPTEDDLKITYSLYSNADLMGIQLVDHLIVTKVGYYSFKDHRKL